ncbi:MAG: MFS transporter [Anaerolineaceae bacterium]
MTETPPTKHANHVTVGNAGLPKEGLSLRVRRFAWLFVPDASIARQLSFQRFMASTFLSDGAREGVRYGALVSIVSSGGSPFRSALLGTIALIPPLVLGLIGGAIADALPRRVALLIIYCLQAAACFLIPVFLGTDFWDVALLIFTINVLGQVSGPTEQSLAPLVASEAQLASANSLLGLCSSAGALVGTALIAPVVVATVGVRPLFVMAAITLVIAANRVYASKPVVPPRKVKSAQVDRNNKSRLIDPLRWLAAEPAVATMVGLGVLAGVANIILQVLAPQYVVEVLGEDPARTVYVFAPSTIGVVLALVAAPFLMRLVGERRCAALALLLTSLSLVLLGSVGHGLNPVIDPVNPLRALDILGLSLSSSLRTAGFLAVPLGFGASLTTACVQTYINRRVPLRLQGRAFALQSSLKNGAAIIPLLTLGAIATVVGVSAVLAASPLVLVAVGFGLVRLSEHFGAHVPVSKLEVLESFWNDHEVPLTPPPVPATG